MKDRLVDGALVSSLVAQFYGAVERDFDNTYSDVIRLGQDPTASLQITGSIMRVSFLDKYGLAAWEQKNLGGYQVKSSRYLDEVSEPGLLPEYAGEEISYAKAIPDDTDDSLLEKEQTIAAVAAYVDNTFTDAALESAESLEIIQKGTRYTIEKLEDCTKVVNQITGATLTFSDDFEDDLSHIEDEGFTAQDYENLKLLTERLLSKESSHHEDQSRKYMQQPSQQILDRKSDIEL